MRKVKYITIADDGRDKGKTYKLTEMDAFAVEWWAERAFLAITNSGRELPPELVGAGLAGWFVLGLNALTGLKSADVKPLLDEMITCVTFVPDPTRQDITRPLFPDDVEELATIIELRKEVWSLHVDFSWADIKWRLDLMSATISKVLSATPTFPEPSEQSSQPGEQPSPSARRSTRQKTST